MKSSMDHGELIKKAIAMFNAEIHGVEVLLVEENTIVFRDPDMGGRFGSTYTLVVSDLYPTVEYYFSQLLNPVNLELGKKYPHLLQYVKLYYIERPYDSSIEDPIDWEFHETGVIEYIPEVTSSKQISRVSIEKTSETEAYCYIYRLTSMNNILYRVSIKTHVGIHYNSATDSVPEAEWMRYIQTAADFLPGPTNRPIHDMLLNSAPRYKGNQLWILGNDSIYIFVDNVWVPLYPGSIIPPRYQDEYNIYRSFDKI